MPRSRILSCMATLRDRQKQQTRQLLLDAAIGLFEQKGYAATTIDEIAVAATTTRATFYLHFGSKADLMRALIAQADAILTEVDDPPLADVVASGRRDLIEQYLSRKFDQWSVIRPYVMAGNQAAPSEPDVAQVIERWFDDTASAMHAGLDRADRFEADTRHIRCVLAFGQLEYLSRRWFQLGWFVPREVCLRTLTDAWCSLLVGE